MPSLTYNYSFIFIIFSTFLLSCTRSVPIPSNPYDAFIDYLTKNNCTMPEEVDIHFLSVSDAHIPFSYLSSPLSECKTPDALKENDEAKFLCEEIFDVLQNITCVEYNTTLPKIESKPLSKDVCKDFKSMQGIFSSKNNYLSGKLVDDTLCKILCSEQKYALLCEMLLWSHDIQSKIKSAIANLGLARNTPNSNEKEISNNVAQKEINADSNVDGKKNSVGVDMNKLESRGTGTSSTTTQTNMVKINNLNTTSSQIELDKKIANISENTKTSVSSQNDSETVNQKVINDLQPVDPKKQPKPGDNDQNEIENDMHPNDKTVEKISTNIATSTVFSSISEVNNKEGSKTTSVVFENKGNNIEKSNTSTKANENSQNSGINSNLIGSNTEGGIEKAKETNLKTAENDKTGENPELANSETQESIKGSPDIDLKQTESTTLQILLEKDKNVEHQEDPDQYPEEYNDNEKEDYPKPEYDNAFNPSLKNKELGDKTSVKESANQMLNSYETFISSRNDIGHGNDNIPVIPSFPEQEDSHFFFYFLSIVLILMAGYLIFHNKQKIIALIVEGRHERRRRSHGSGYKKLETK